MTSSRRFPRTIGLMWVSMVALLSLAWGLHPQGANAQAGEAPVITDIRFVWSAGTSGEIELAWTNSLNGQGLPADRYQVVAWNNMDGVRPGVFEVTQEFAAETGGTTRGVVRWTANFLGGTRYLRAVWDDGSPPMETDIQLASLAADTTELRVTRPRATTARVSTTTAECTYGDYRVTDNGTRELMSAFDAPRDGQCFTSHGITLGIDTPALKPDWAYTVTFVAVDPESGEARYVSRVFFTPKADGTNTVRLGYSEQEWALVERAASQLQMTPTELQKTSTLLFAYLAAVQDKPSVRIDPPDWRGENSAQVTFNAEETNFVDDLADNFSGPDDFGGIYRSETVKISTLVLSYVVLTS